MTISKSLPLSTVSLVDSIITVEIYTLYFVLKVIFQFNFSAFLPLQHPRLFFSFGEIIGQTNTLLLPRSNQNSAKKGKSSPTKYYETLSPVIRSNDKSQFF